MFHATYCFGNIWYTNLDILINPSNQGTPNWARGSVGIRMSTRFSGF